MIVRLQIQGSAAKPYDVTADPETGATTCSCPAWRNKKFDKPRDCKHVRSSQVQDVLGGVSMLSNLRDVVAIELDPPPSASANDTPKPMLAVAMTKGVQTFEDFCQPGWALEEKLDGHRVVARVRGGQVVAWSRPRSGEVAKPRDLSKAPAIKAGLLTLPDGVYDGELMTSSTVIHAARRRASDTYVIFDILEVLGKPVTKLPYAERRALLVAAFAHYTQAEPEGTALAIPASVPVTDEALSAIWDAGGEGAILKRTAATYQPGKRSPDWVKVKKLGHRTLTITGYEAGENGPYSKVELDGGKKNREHGGTTCKVKNNALLAAMKKDPASFIGRRLVVQFTELTDEGKMRHGVWDHFAAATE